MRQWSRRRQRFAAAAALAAVALVAAAAMLWAGDEAPRAASQFRDVGVEVEGLGSSAAIRRARQEGRITVKLGEGVATTLDRFQVRQNSRAVTLSARLRYTPPPPGNPVP